MEVIPDIKTSVGYISVKKSLEIVFGASVVLKKYEGVGIGENDAQFYNDFRMVLTYRNIDFMLWIGDTRTKGMMNSGSLGGYLSIMIPNYLVPNFKSLSGWAWNPLGNGELFTELWRAYIDNSEIVDFLKYEGASGNNLETMKKSLQILKDYLDEQIRLKREEEDRNSFGF